jgi:hypothetical protein
VATVAVVLVRPLELPQLQEPRILAVAVAVVLVEVLLVVLAVQVLLSFVTQSK